MTGCPNCHHITSPTILVFRRSCPNCNRRLRSCVDVRNCETPIADDCDLECDDLGRTCPNGRPVYTTGKGGTWHHHDDAVIEEVDDELVGVPF